MTWFLDADRLNLTLEWQGKTTQIPVTSVVRNLETAPEFRKVHPVRSIPSGEFYDPQPFPSGKWKVTGRPIQKNRETSPEVWPYFIPTDAGRMVNRWEVKNGAYSTELSSSQVWDSGYGFHCSDGPYTLGCVKVTYETMLLMLVQIVNHAFDTGQEIEIVAA